MLRPTLRISPFLFMLAGCKVSASASATVSAEDIELDVDARVEADAPAFARVTIRKQGDELVQQGGQINFAYDAATLEGEQTFATLQAFADTLTQFPEVALRIEGHTDSRGSDSRNRELSQRRAEAVRDWLIEHGIAAERLEALGRGEDSAKVAEPPECHNKKAETAAEWCEERVWSQNRRSEFRIVKGGETLPDGELANADDEVGPAPENIAHDQSGPGFWPGFYIYASPAFFTTPIATRDEILSRRISYRWGLGAGYLWRRQRFMAALGLGFSHVPVNIRPGNQRCAELGCFTANDLLIDAELRIGGGGPRVVGYALLAPGLALGISQDVVGRYATPGFGLDLGVGVWGLVWRGLFLGGEALVTPTVYAGSVTNFHASTTHVGFALRFLAGWHFGWRAR
jgi:outer membrane protein OmpA-like peptidoglycan-associated protein